MKYSVVLLAAGCGKRLNLGYNKILHIIHGQPIIALTTTHFYQDPRCKQLIFVCQSEEMDQLKQLLQEHQLFDERCQFVVGGSERQHSVHYGLNEVTQDIVLIHDGARPFLTKELIDDILFETKLHGCAIPTLPVTDTIKQVNRQGFIEKTLKRSSLVAVQTPQGCQTKWIKLAHDIAKSHETLHTDDASLIEFYQLSKVKTVEGSYDNIKITTPNDLITAQQLYKQYFQTGDET